MAQFITHGAVPGYLAVADVIVAVDLLLPFQHNGVHRVKEIEGAVLSQGNYIVGTAVDTVFWGQVHASREAADGRKHILTGAPELGIVVSKGNGPRNAAIGNRLKYLQGAFYVRTPEDYVSCMDNEIRLLCGNHFLNAPKGPFTSGIPLDVMGIRKLKKLESAAGAVIELTGYVQVLRLRTPLTAKQRRHSRRSRHGKSRPLEE